MSDELIGIKGFGTYFPQKTENSQYIAEQSNIPWDVVENKFGVIKKTVPGPEDTASNMGLWASQKALMNADIDAKSIDLVIWNGAQHKDFPCWLASLDVAHRLGAINA